MAELCKISYKDEAGVLQQERPVTEIAALPSPRFYSIRESVTNRRRPHMPGYFWMSRLNILIPYQSRLEIPVLLQLDYNPRISSICPQPFVVHLSSGLVHVPRYYVEFGAEDALVLDIRVRAKPVSEKLQQAFDETHKICKEAGWRYSIQAEPDPTFLTNLQWLAGFRRKPPYFDDLAEQIVEACLTSPQSFENLVTQTGRAYAARPVIFHLLWLRLLYVDLTQPLSNQSLIDLPKE